MEAPQETSGVSELEKFQSFTTRLTRLGFRSIPHKEKRDHRRVINLVPPKGRKKRIGQEMFVFNHSSGLSVIVLTTFNMATGSLLPKGQAQAWVLITEPGIRPPYIAPPIKRTGKFWNKLLQRVKVCHQRVVNIPICSCGRYMSITRSRKAIGARFWRCKHKENHTGKKLPRACWDVGLSPQNLKLVKEWRKVRDKYRKKRRAAGKDPNHARLHRKRWTQTSLF